MTALELSPAPTAAEIDWAYGLICQSHWGLGIPRATFAKAAAHSICFVARRGGIALGFARVVTDRATFAYLCDVIVEDACRGQGIGKALIETLLAHPDLQGLRRLCLMTRDAHGLYARYGFAALPDPTRFMQIHHPYLDPAAT